MNASICDDIAKLIDAGTNPLDTLSVAFTGKTNKAKDREGTNLTRMMAFGILDASRINPKLAPLNHYASARGYGGKYLGRIVSDQLYSAGLATKEQYVNLTLPSLWTALRSDDWGKQVDLYNQLLVPLQKHGPCGAGLGITVLACPADMVWKDHTNNQQLPMLLCALLQGVGLPSKGKDSLPTLLTEMNNFIAFQGGGGAARMNAILDAAAKYMRGLFSEASTNLNMARDPSNLEAPPLISLLDSTGDKQGARYEWIDFCKKTAAATDMQVQMMMVKPVDLVAEFEGIKKFAYTATGHEHDAKRERPDDYDNKKPKSRRQLAAERHAGGDGGGGGGGKTGGLQQPGGQRREQPDYSQATVSFAEQGRTIVVGPTSEGKNTKYDAAAMRKALPEGACLPYFVTKGLNKCPNGCLHQGHPDHQANGAAHTWPTGVAALKSFNMNKGGGKGKGQGGGASKGTGKGGAKGKGGSKGGSKGKGGSM